MGGVWPQGGRPYGWREGRASARRDVFRGGASGVIALFLPIGQEAFGRGDQGVAGVVVVGELDFVDILFQFVPEDVVPFKLQVSRVLHEPGRDTVRVFAALDLVAIEVVFASQIDGAGAASRWAEGRSVGGLIAAEITFEADDLLIRGVIGGQRRRVEGVGGA